MQYKPDQCQKGFSLIELMISLVLFLLVLAGIFQLFESNRSTYATGEKRADVQQNARVAMDEISRQVRMAGYFPENFDTNVGNDIANGNAVHVATNGAVAVFGDANGSGSSNVLLFCLDGTTLRRASTAAGSAAAYTCSTGETLADNISSLRFTYYGADNATIPNPAAAPYQLDGQNLGAVPSFTDVSQRRAVRRIVVTLTGSQTVPRRGPQTYSLTSDVRLRNVN